jgi:hypothetical protein
MRRAWFKPPVRAAVVADAIDDVAAIAAAAAVTAADTGGWDDGATAAEQIAAYVGAALIEF